MENLLNAKIMSDLKLNIDEFVEKQVDFFDSYFVNESSALEKRTSCFFHLAAYKNKTTKYNNQEDHLFYESLVLPELNYNTNVYEQIYAFVKTLPGYTEIKNDL